MYAAMLAHVPEVLASPAKKNVNVSRECCVWMIVCILLGVLLNLIGGENKFIRKEGVVIRFWGWPYR